MSQKLTELKKQAAEIAEQIKQLESESPEEKLRRIIGEQVGAASMCWERVDCAGVFDSRRASVCADEIMEAVNEYVSEAVSDESFMNNELTLVLKNQSARIAELESAPKATGGMELLLIDSIELRDARIKELQKELAEKDAQLINAYGELDDVLGDRDGVTADFTTKTEPMPLRPAIEYLKEFPEPWRTAALKAVEEMPLHPLMVVNSAKKALLIGFRWGARSAGDKWRFLYTAMRNGTEWPAAELFID